MEARLTATAILTAVSVLALFSAWRWCYLPAINAAFRQDLFALRRELFLYAADGNIPFSSPAYTHLRYVLNGSLRFAERMTLGRVLFTIAMTPQSLCETESAALIAQIDDSGVRARLQDLHSRFGEVVGRHMLLGSPPLALVIFTVAIGFVALTSLSRAKKEAVARIQRVAERLSETGGGGSACNAP